MGLFGQRRVRELEYRVACLKYDLEELRKQLETKGLLVPERKPPEIRPNPHLMGPDHYRGR